MQFSLVLLTLAAAVSAQDTSVPSCATSCITDLLPSDCNGSPKCICSASTFIDNISCCIYKACDTTDQNSALSYARNICTPVGVTDLPTAATCTGTQAVSTSTASGSSSTAASDTTTATATATTTTAASAAASSSDSGSSRSATTGASSSATGTSTSTSTSTSTASSSSSSSSSASSSSASAASTSNAANSLTVQGAGVVCAGLLGLAGML